MTNLKILLLFSLIPALFHYAIAQEKNKIVITGEVRDTVSQEILAHTLVRIKGKAIGITTNSEGKFSLILPAQDNSDSLSISLMGYISKTVALNDLSHGMFYIFRLLENPVLLEEVIVSVPDAGQIVKEVSRRLKEIFPSKPFEFEGHYRNAYSELCTSKISTPPRIKHEIPDG